MKNDKRVKYTKMFLKDCLIQKLSEKHISRITVSELAEGAEINRSTFYAHYTDQYDLLKQIEDEFFSEISLELNTKGSIADETIALETTEKLIQYILDNSSLCKVMLGNNGNIDFQQHLTDIISDATSYSTTDLDEKEKTITDLNCFVSAGCTALIKKWLFSEKDDRHPSELAELLLSLVVYGSNTVY